MVLPGNSSMAASILDFGFRFENYCRGCRVNGVGYGVLGVGCGVLEGDFAWEY